MKFKPGDKLIALQNALGKGLNIEVGKIYTCLKYDRGSRLFLKESPKFSFFEHRFELAQPYLNEQKLKKVLGL